jgi:hypothetical protein
VSKRKLEGISRGEVSQHPGHVFVARGDVALTRALLARGAIRVLTTRRGRVEQLGVAALPEAIAAAEAEVAATADERAVSREKSREARARAEVEYREAFDREVRRLFPGIPEKDRLGIVAQACEVSSGRVGRTAWAKSLDPEPITLAVRAWIRHAHTDYDARLRKAGFGQAFGRATRDDKKAARAAILPTVEAVVVRWKDPDAPPGEAAPAPVVEERVVEAKPPSPPAKPGRRLWERPLG